MPICVWSLSYCICVGCHNVVNLPFGNAYSLKNMKSRSSDFDTWQNAQNSSCLEVFIKILKCIGDKFSCCIIQKNMNFQCILRWKLGFQRIKCDQRIFTVWKMIKKHESEFQVLFSESIACTRADFRFN